MLIKYTFVLPFFLPLLMNFDTQQPTYFPLLTHFAVLAAVATVVAGVALVFVAIRGGMVTTT